MMVIHAGTDVADGFLDTGAQSGRTQMKRVAMPWWVELEAA